MKKRLKDNYILLGGKDRLGHLYISRKKGKKDNYVQPGGKDTRTSIYFQEERKEG